MTQDEEIQVLTELGLTLLQARVYLALSSLGETTARNIAALSKIARQEVYRIVDQLVEIGLVSKIVAAPTKFQPLPLSDGTAILLEHQIKKTNELKTKVEKIAKKHITTRKKDVHANFRFEMLPQQAPWFKGKVLSLESSERFDLMTSIKRLSSRINLDQSVFRKAAAKGTKIRILTEKPPPNSLVTQIINDLRKHPNIKIRFLRSFQDVILTIIDGKEVALALTPKNRVGPPYLVSDHPSYIVMAQQFFEVEWEKASDS